MALVALSPLVSRGEPSVPEGGARADTINDPDFANKIVDVFRDCQKIKPGMTRAELVELQMFNEDSGPLHSMNDKSFKPHATFYYRSCALIKVDVDFAATEAKDARPTDMITRVSMPYIDARSRR